MEWTEALKKDQEMGSYKKNLLENGNPNAEITLDSTGQREWELPMFAIGQGIKNNRGW